MSAKLLKLLRIGALIFGWLLLIGMVASIWETWMNYNLFLRPQKFPLGIPTAVTGFKIWGALGSFFSNLASAVLAFLIASVFRMIDKQAPVGKENAQRLMIVCCLSYIAHALMQILSFISNMQLLIQLEVLGYKRMGSWFPFSLTVFPAFVPLVYAITIYVLYTHFTRMVTFESEVA